MVYKKIDKLKNVIITSFFITIFILGISVVNDYGVSSDEYSSKIRGYVTLNYLGEKFLPSINQKFKGDKDIVKLSDYKRKMYGVVFEVPAAFLEIVIGIKDKKDQFLFRHYLNFFVFFLSLISFFQLIQCRFSNWKIALLGVLILFLTPRIFANSFYNNKDLVFMSFFIFAMNSGIRFFRLPSYKNSLLFSIFAALAIDVRVMGVIIPVTILFLIFLHVLIYKDLIVKYFLPSILFLFYLTIFVILFWPYLWESPIENFIFAFKGLANFQFDGANLFLGKITNAAEVPWNYIPVWIIITTPIIYLILFLSGLLKFFIQIFSFSEVKDKKIIFQDSFFLIIFFVSLISIIILNSTLYNGWRQMYFIYPSFVMITLLGFNFFRKFLKNKYQKFIFSILIIYSFLNISFWMIVNHPHQYVYFNRLAGDNIQNRFDMDYWGLSYKENLQYILKTDHKDKIYIFGNSNQHRLIYHLFSLEEKKRSRIVIVDNKNQADYLITSFFLDQTKYDEIFFEKYMLLNEVVVDKKSINSVYKKIN